MNTFIHFLFNPTVVSLLAGIVIGSLSHFKFHSFFIELISIYLIFTIGFKGGSCLSTENQCTPPLVLLALIGIFIGFIQPFLHYAILKKTTSLNKETAAVIASEYGSISIITFITATTFLSERAITYDAFMSSIAGIMEIPAIFSGLWIIKKGQKNTRNQRSSFLETCKAIVTCKKISFIFIGFFIGLLFRNYPTHLIPLSIIWPFNIMLIFFMLDIGINIIQQKNAIALFKPSLILFALYMPLINGFLGLIIGHYLVESIGSLTLFAVLISSASYIAVPAVMKTQVQNAEESIYLPLPLGITLPFNILIGIPLYYYSASFLKAI